MNHCVSIIAVFVAACLSIHVALAEDRLADSNGKTGNSAAAPVSQIMFGSCIKQEEPMPILKTITDQRPDLFIFLGDNVYADTNDPEIMKQNYATLKSNDDFTKLMNACPVMATWDDHDYGANNAGAEYPMRAEAEQIFLDFWNEPADSLRRKRPGIHDAKLFGPDGKIVQVILLDTRYFRGPIKQGEKQVGGSDVPTDDTSITMLGDAQWKWLARQLQIDADVRIICSGIQCVAQSSGQETWSNLPHERQRLFDLIASSKAKNVFILSGDRHWSELSVATEKTPYPIYDLTSSSLNQIHPRGTPTENRFRDIATTYHQPNFGAIDIDWQTDQPKVTLSIRDAEGKPVFEKIVKLNRN